jgi:hypothetical protein
MANGGRIIVKKEPFEVSNVSFKVKIQDHQSVNSGGVKRGKLIVF